MSVTWLLAWRFLRKRSSPLLAASARAALVAVALGVAALVTVMALMSGYRTALKQGILAVAGHVLVVPASDDLAAELERVLAGAKGVEGLGKTLFLPGLVGSDPQAPGEAITLKAADRVPTFVGKLAASEAGPLPVAMGEGLAGKLQVTVGDTVFLQLAHGSGRVRYLPARVEAVFASGFAELREGWLFSTLAGLFQRGSGWGTPLLEVYLENPEEADRFARDISPSVGARALVHTWSELNRELFAALRWQKITLGLVLSLIVGVGAFEVASALVVLVTEKRRELGILMAMGASPPVVRRTVILAGGLLGTCGVVVGVAFGVGLVFLLEALGVPRFSQELASIYMVSRIPWEVRLWDVVAVVGAGTGEVLLASVAAARPLARREPAQVLRWV